MGYDLSSEIKSLISGTFFLSILYVNLKIFFIYFLFYAILEVIFETELKLKSRLIYFIFLFITLLLFVHSVVTYPQLYGEFFLIKQVSLKPLLYFLTDSVNPALIQHSLLALFLFLALMILIHFFYKPNLIHAMSFLFWSFTLLMHCLNFGIGIICLFLVYQYTRFFYSDMIIKRYYSIPIVFFPILLILIYFSFQNIFQPKYSQDPENPNLILIAADSFRADTIGLKLNSESVTPNIDEFKKDAFQFSDHHVTVPRTFPSWADLLTGEFGMSHKIRDMFPAPKERDNLGKSEFLTLGHYLQKEKKFSTGVISNFAGDIFPRADFGFEFIDAPNFTAKVLIVQKNLEFHVLLLPLLTGSFIAGGEYFSELQGFSSLGDGKRLLPKIKSFIKSNSGNPFFLTSFFSVTHFPYSPPYPDYKKFTDEKYYGDYKYFKFVDPTNDKKPNQKDIEQILALFHSSVYSFDKSFGEIISFLKKENLYENSIIVLTGDHGESIYEDIHGHGHGEHLRGDHVTKVPLLIKFPKGKYAEVSEKDFKGITSSVDFVPTILDFYNIKPNKTLEGKSLINFLGKIDYDFDRMVYSETGIWFSDIGDHFFQSQRIPYPSILKLHKIIPEEDYQIMITDPYYRDTIAFSKHRSIQTSQYKLIYIPTREGVIFEFYDKISDPLNQRNIFDLQSPMINIMKKELYRLAETKENAEIIGDYIFPPPIE